METMLEIYRENKMKIMCDNGVEQYVQQQIQCENS